MDEKLAESTEAFIGDLYPKTRRQTSTMDALRYDPSARAITSPYNSDLSCTEACLCMADETCKNPHTAVFQCDSESEEESDDDLENEEDGDGIDED